MSPPGPTRMSARDLAKAGEEIAKFLDVVSTTNRSAVVRELCARLTGATRKAQCTGQTVRETWGAPATPIPQMNGIDIIVPGKVWCGQCDRAVLATTAAVCTKRFCKVNGL